jgi:hypothetical protein
MNLECFVYLRGAYEHPLLSEQETCAVYLWTELSLMHEFSQRNL